MGKVALRDWHASSSTRSPESLVEDDEGLVLRTIRAVLKDKGQTVDTVADVRQALERYPPLPGARRAGT